MYKTIRGWSLVLPALLIVCLCIVAGRVVLDYFPGEGVRGVLSETAISKAPYIEINLYSKRLVLYRGGEVVKSYPVGVGKPSTRTPVGEWAIIHKSKGWGGGFGSHWLGLNVPWGIYGIHGTNKPWLIGGEVSHGCIRMHNDHVEELYGMVPVKTRVKIIGKRLPVNVDRPLVRGQTGLAVMQLQDNLNQRGFMAGFLDGRYGQTTEEAVAELEAQYGLRVDGRADWNVLYLLELPSSPR